ncbi:S41 family peptidase [Gangjinia marincola]|uniref:S41 family peptidase n=1 Tax=Gangjinia marincola TaxID=578463 RepID=A0ABN1MGI6_9FLAO
MKNNYHPKTKQLYKKIRKTILITGVFFLVSACSSVKKYNEQIAELHTVDELRSDIDKTYTQFKRHHPRLYQYTPKKVLDRKVDSLKMSINEPMSSHEFYEKLSVILANIRQGHITVIPPQERLERKGLKAFRKKKFELSELEFEYLDDKVFVARSFGKDSILVGSEVLKFNHENVIALIRRYNRLYSSDGYNTTFHSKYSAFGLEKFYRRDHGRINSLPVTFKLNDSIFTRVFTYTDRKPTKIDTLAPADKKKLPILSKEEKKAKRLAQKEKKKRDNKFGFIPEKKTDTRTLTFKDQDSTTAHMRISNFSRGNYKAFYDDVFKMIDTLDTENLIIDLRNNTGGRLSEIEYLYSYLVDEPYIFINESEVNSRLPYLKYLMANTQSVAKKGIIGMMSPILITHNLINTTKRNDTLYYRFKQSKQRKPKSNNFKGKVYVLINGVSFSASSVLSTKLKATGRAILVGEETGGAHNGTVAGIFKMYELPHSKLKVRIGLMQIDTPHKIYPDGYGVQPNIPIQPTVMNRKRRIDPELEWVLNDIQKRS